MKARQKSKTRGKARRQYAALPVRFDAQGRLRILLLTSRGTGRWIIPKGWPMRKISPAAAAAREAYEEAGLEGVIESDVPVGHYRYLKWLNKGRRVEITVDVFLLRVLRQLDAWPEQAQRNTRWCDPEEAAALVDEPELATLLLNGLGTLRAGDFPAPEPLMQPLR